MAQGYKDFTAGASLAAADLEDYCELQAVMRFVDTTARDTALSAVKTSGMLAYTTADKSMWVYDGTNWLQYGSATSWTTVAAPTLTNVTGGAATLKYVVIGKTMIFFGEVTAGTATAAGSITVSLGGATGATTGGQPQVISAIAAGTTVITARVLSAGTGVQIFGTNAGGNFGAGASVICSFSGTIQLA
jgi:hypothetical protein